MPRSRSYSLFGGRGTQRQSGDSPTPTTPSGADPSSGPRQSPGYWLSPGVLSALPREVSPTVPAENRSAPYFPRTASGGGSRSRIAASPWRSTRLPLMASGRGEDGEDWSTVVSEDDAAPMPPSPTPGAYQPRYQHAGSSLANNSSIEGLSLPSALRQARGLPQSSGRLQMSSSRSYAHPSGSPAGHPMANVPHLPAGPAIRAADGGTRPREFAGAYFNDASEYQAARRGDDIQERWNESEWADTEAESVPPGALEDASATQLVNPGSFATPPQRRGGVRIVGGASMEDITESVLGNTSGPPPPLSGPARSHRQWARNVQRAVASRTSRPEAVTATPTALFGDHTGYPVAHLPRPGRLTEPPQHSSPLLPPTPTATGYFALQSHREIGHAVDELRPPPPVHHLGYSEMLIDEDLYIWGSQTALPHMAPPQTRAQASPLRRVRSRCCGTEGTIVCIFCYCAAATVFIVLGAGVTALIFWLARRQ